ncbi:hypothetical protein HAX54_016596 [Datura stramonium]|uniref:Uncharacterized protein n=1 Tax=Datura stramonium TaxID=4076 RepID=A0ABS8UKS9_DATST|nr:hypothetical protein [Datura stramonium]
MAVGSVGLDMEKREGFDFRCSAARVREKREVFACCFSGVGDYGGFSGVAPVFMVFRGGLTGEERDPAMVFSGERRKKKRRGIGDGGRVFGGEEREIGRLPAVVMERGRGGGWYLHGVPAAGSGLSPEKMGRRERVRRLLLR